MSSLTTFVSTSSIRSPSTHATRSGSLLLPFVAATLGVENRDQRVRASRAGQDLELPVLVVRDAPQVLECSGKCLAGDPLPLAKPLELLGADYGGHWLVAILQDLRLSLGEANDLRELLLGLRELPVHARSLTCPHHVAYKDRYLPDAPAEPTRLASEASWPDPHRVTHLSCILLAALVMAGCSSETRQWPPDEASARATGTEAPSGSGPVLGAVASQVVDAKPHVSGQAPPAIAPPAPSDRSAAILRELEALEPRELRAFGGSGSLLTPDGGTRKPGDAMTRVAGRPPKDATIEDIRAALQKAGCTTTRLDSPAQGAAHMAIFDAKCGGKGFVVTFIPASARMPGDEVITDFEHRDAVFSDSGVLLVVRPASSEDRVAAKELLDAIVTREDAASGGSIANASAVIAGMRAGFRRCYAQGLKDDPTMSGSLTVDASIGPTGEVVSATTKRVKGLSASVASCIKAVVSSRTFAPPEGGSATLSIPVTFTQQQ